MEIYFVSRIGSLYTVLQTCIHIRGNCRTAAENGLRILDYNESALHRDAKVTMTSLSTTTRSPRYISSMSLPSNSSVPTSHSFVPLSDSSRYSFRLFIPYGQGMFPCLILFTLFLISPPQFFFGRVLFYPKELHLGP